MEVQTPDHGTPAQTNITAQTGGTTCAPVIDGNTVQGSLTVINNIYGAQEAPTSSSSSVQAGCSPGASALTKEYITVCKQTHKSELEKTFRSIKEGLSHDGNSMLLNKIYTELYITEGGSGEVNSEHEVRQIETKFRRRPKQETPIKCNDIFKHIPGKDKPIRTVLTRGIAGIGKTVSVQKFILDWIEGKANQDVTFIFPLPFRELNLIKHKKLSLMDLLHLFFPQTKQFRLIDLINCADCTVMFILDGLDECRPPLHLEKNEILSDETESASVDVLLTNLIRGKLLSSSLLWITTRPAAVSQILLQHINLVTEIRGFSDPQKEEYFRKRISDQRLAKEIITHIKSSRSLYIMCHIPVFCWISATVLEEMLSEVEIGEIPRTLTQMFTYFLNFQIKHSSQKCRGNRDTNLHQTRNIILALGKLAFQQLENGNIIFYEDDLRQCGINIKDVSVYSEVCTQIFREESALHLEKVFSFIHLTVQEFLAALYAFFSFISNHRNVLLEQATGCFAFFKKPQMFDFLSCAVDKALKSENEHLNLFLRFLLGFSLESNQTLLQRLLPELRKSSHSKEQIVWYIKKKIRENPSAEKSINLFHCLNELNDHSLVQEVQKYLNRSNNSGFSGAKLSPAQWSALVFVLLNSEEQLDEFILRKYDPSEECLLRLLPVVKASRKAVLGHCSITEEGCVALVKALKSNLSNVSELDLSWNNPGYSGVKELSDLLKEPHCKLEKLHLEMCSITSQCCAVLINSLKSNPSSHLRELDLSWNDPGESGVKELSDLLKNPHCKLEKLHLSDCSITDKGCVALVKALKSNPSTHLKELNLNNNELKDSGAKELSDLLEDPLCKLETLELAVCSITGEGCAALANALKSNPSSQLKELNLNRNYPGDSAVKKLSDLLKDPHCKLQKLGLSECRITGKSGTLVKALKSNRLSQLREFNLKWNKPGNSAVKEVSGLLEDPHCKLEKLNLRTINSNISCIVNTA
ncbi:NACHT, LRR and PYD domains-containing protein 3-like isoform X2 [Pygocentrus nattereri]|uniref:NACHT, LRR and PYD domains-containing protein 3-like isoform X2 n=1 Tax=Pygocentrus nattereri TaxID=42514 RepID=UPI001891EC68|nr:NACHT, LRR and PYD domains-containing protein 3-like isoform X2 [Pygocentrus nattereri]